MLTGLAAGVKGARDLGAAEGPVVQIAAVFPGEGHALRHALVNDVQAHLRQSINVRLSRAEITALDGVVE